MSGYDVRLQVAKTICRALGVPVSIPAVLGHEHPPGTLPTVAELNTGVDLTVYLCPTETKD